MLIALTIALNLPITRKNLAKNISAYLSTELNTKVAINDIHISLFNSIRISQSHILDQNGDTLIKFNSLITRLNFNDLLNKRITINSLELQDATLTLIKNNSGTNFQFIVDKLSTDSIKESNIDINLKTLMIHNLNLKYNDLNLPNDYKNRFNKNHLNIRNIEANIGIYCPQDNQKTIRIRNLSFNEKCGIEITHLAAICHQDGNNIQLKKLECITKNSSIESGSIAITLHPQTKKITDINLNNSKLKLSIYLPEFSPFIPQLNNINLIPKLNAKFFNKGNILDINLNISEQKGLMANINTKINLSKFIEHNNLSIQTKINHIEISPNVICEFLQKNKNKEIHNIIQTLGIIKHEGTLDFDNNILSHQGKSSCDAGIINDKTKLANNQLHTKLQTQSLDLSVIDINAPKNINSLIEVKGPIKEILNLDVKAAISQIEYNNYLYHGINLTANYTPYAINATINSNDPNASLTGNIKYQRPTQIFLTAQLQNIKPQILHLSNTLANASVKANITADIKSLSPYPVGSVSLKDVCITDSISSHYLDSFVIHTEHNDDIHHDYLKSNMFDITYNGNFPENRLPATFYNIIRKKIKVLPDIFKEKDSKVLENPYSAYFDIHIKDLDFLENVLHLPISINNHTTIKGWYHSQADQLKLSAFIPSFTYDGSSYRDGSLYLAQIGDSINLLGQLTKGYDTNDVKFVLNTEGTSMGLMSNFEWKILNDVHHRGKIKANTSFSANINGDINTHVQIFPSQILIADSIWTIDASSLDFGKNDYQIHNFRLSHKNQFVSISNNNANQKEILTKLNDIDLDYVFDLLNFHPVYFSGSATGNAIITKPAQHFRLDAQLQVDRFKFNYGDMGTLHLNAMMQDGILHLDAITQQTKQDTTLIKGYVNIGADSINLKFHSHKTNLEFLNHYLGGIFHHLQGTTTGNLHLFGPLSGMNLEGQEKIDYLSIKPKVLNTTYLVNNDSLIFKPGRIYFKNWTLNDAIGGKSSLHGNVSHKELGDFSFNMKFNMSNLLIYDWSSRETDTFWGTVYTDGSCLLHGNTDDVRIDVDLTPTRNTTFTYDSSKPTADAASTEFIHFTPAITTHPTKVIKKNSTKEQETQSLKDTSSDIHLNLNINANPNATLVFLTDNKTGDNMSLNGSGIINANYYNKGKFNLYGTYLIDHGLYKMTIKEIIHKNFNIQPGGTIKWGGAPMDGIMNLKGTYTVNSVSLGDLNLGNLNQGSTANVDCILNFTGMCKEPQVSFDLDFHNIQEEEKQMVRNMISSQGDMNMQIIYLLSIGRFFTYDYDNLSVGGQSQSSIAMQSLLASTLSEHFNNMLSNAFNLKGWKFGTNIATGRYGWDDMEVEGLLSGSLLNNRVLINGNFGYRDQSKYTYNTNNFVGDFNLRWLLTKSGVISLKAYSETNDRYFTKNSLITNGVGILFQRDFNNVKSLFQK